MRTPFGARLSRARAWSAAALLAPLVYLQLCMTVQYGWTPGWTVDLALSVGILVALAARLPWARAMVLGVLLTTVGWDVMWLAGGGGGTHVGLELLACGGALAFTIPWGRHELSPGALALALLGPAYAAAATIMQLQITWSRSHGRSPAVGAARARRRARGGRGDGRARALGRGAVPAGRGRARARDRPDVVA